MKKIVVLLLAGLAVVVAGCAQPGGSSGVAVLDLGRVATETGQDVVIREKADAARAELMAQLQQLASGLDQQLAEEREKVGENASEEDSLRLQQITIQAQQQIGAAQQQAQQQAGQVESDLVIEFREMIEPLAEEIARERGVSAVMAADAYMFWHDPAVDITDDIIAAYKALPGAMEELAVEASEAGAELEQAADDLGEAVDEAVEQAAEESAVPAAE